MVRVLLAAKALVNIQDKVSFAIVCTITIIFLCAFGFTCIVSDWKGQFSTYSIFCDFLQDGFTVLHVAALRGHLRLVEWLIAAKADVNIQTYVSHI